MYAYFRGRVVSVLPEEAVLEVSGIAYRFLISGGTARTLPAAGGEAVLYTHLSVREDALQLYGFSSEEEKQLFRLLLLVSGVGPKLALAVLSALPVGEVHEAILSNAPDRLFGVTGVGRKTAARIILELRDRILKLSPGAAASVPAGVQAAGTRDDATSALVTLGFSKAAAEAAVSTELRSNPDGSVEEILKSALGAMHNR
ncbi:Holliday junction branch migration protein RuvA [Chlorobium sp. N1]|uniref:Holliday junction branch migration protein RuvA n=1 Tax=Chlorobium sp. N1 TaxID=2491138 RepID=UPI00103EA936|nr:Holliday junction branch migration protein RuvA [Chlorobium sp. N1]TCD48888.1 Holliday junction branch migration protein RuvA [Chlorobium sp. N1]